MAATSPVFSICPFCGSTFKNLGSHLSHCKLRGDGEYEHLLCAKTLPKRTKAKNKSCPICNKQFACLNTHLRLSRSCQIHPITIQGKPVQPDHPQQPVIPLHPQGEFVPPVTDQLPALKLPRSDKEWIEADRFFAKSVVPSVVAAHSVDVVVSGNLSVFE